MLCMECCAACSTGSVQTVLHDYMSAVWCLRLLICISCGVHLVPTVTCGRVLVCAVLCCALQGYGFCEFADGAVVNGVIKSLHNSVVDGRKITVKRADDDSAPASISGSST
jgi:hypothetical protein